MFSRPKILGACAMGKRGGHTNTGEGVKGKKARTTSDDAGGKSVSENSCIRSLSEDASIKQTWLGTANVRRQFPVSSAHACVQSARKNIREDLKDTWVTRKAMPSVFFQWT